ncbi:M1 family metallopeptidase [Lentzea nigeriaca]|uniref:M1 family metallopeptidase n=1 Tax=Lentzea nigeriaca TaxID=1128665 RepID=UPI00195DB459|nr:M1 family metallopeptidase [Lentzea nigeriaca]MBM7857272.1 aminopeptidase N [Lentzea nigeriaca]
MKNTRPLTFGLRWRLPATTAVIAGLLAWSETTTTAAPQGGPVDITAYDLTIDYQPGESLLRGSAMITATAGTALDEITLRLRGPEASAVTVNGMAARSFVQNGDENLAISPAKRIAGGTAFRIRVDYEGKPGDGWLPTESGGASAFEGDASAWFPVGDDQDKAEFRLTATAPAGWSVVAVGREERSTEPNTFQWHETEVAPAHLAVSIDRFTVERTTLADGTPVVHAYAPGLRDKAKPLADRTPQILDFLTGRYGPYPFSSAGNVFVHVNEDGPGTSPQTRPVYLGAGSKYMDLLQVVHEQAHQWYGVSAAHRSPEDACLSECFASHSTWMWEESIDGVDLDARFRDIVNARKTDAAFWQNALYKPGERPGFAAYDRGPLALHALHKQIGDEAFGSLLRQWAQQNHQQFVSWPQFEQLAEQISGRDLDGFFQAWFRGTTVPADAYLWPGGSKP